MKNTPFRPKTVPLGRLKRKIRLAQLALAALVSCATLVYGAGSTVAFNAPTSFDLAGGGVGNRIAVGDFNRDGNPDVAVTPDANAAEAFPNLDGVNILFGDGQGSFPNNTSFVAGEFVTDMAAADFSGDGILDVAITQSFTTGFGFGFFCNSALPRVPVLLGSAAGTFTLQTPCLTAGRLPGAIAAADFDEDGKLDLLVTVSLNDVNTVDVATQFLSGNGNGTFAPARQFNTQKADRAVVADFNRDGHLDVAMAGGSYVYHGTARGTLVRGQLIGPPSWRDIAVGDVNADGIPDLAGVGSNTSSPGDDLVSVVLGQPNGSFVALGSPLPTGANPALESHPTAVAIADMNGDGYGDVVVLNNQSDDVAVFLRNPAGTFHPRQTFSTRALTARGTTNTAPRGLAVADWNKDGYPDIVVSNHNPTIDGTPDDGTVTVLIQQAIARPSAVDDAAATPENTSVTVQAWSNDSDSLGALDIGTVAVVGGPSHGMATANGDGTIAYMPSPNFAGFDSFTYTIKNNSGTVSNIATVSVMVKRANRLPLAVDDKVAALTNAAVVIPVLANDFDPEGALVPATVTLQTLPASGTASVDAVTGTVTYTPSAAGGYSFTYTVQDAGGATTNIATVTVSVTRANAPPLALDDSATTSPGTPVAIPVLANDSDPDGDVIDRTKIAIVAVPAHGGLTVNTATGAITYTPAAGYSGPDSFAYTVKDIRGATSNPATVSITVGGGNQPPLANNGSLAVTEDVAGGGTLSATDPEGNALTFSIVSNGTKGTATITNAATGAYVYTPNANTNSTDSFTFRASDGSLNSNLATVTVTISAVNDAPAPTAPAISTSEDTAGSSQVAPNDPDAGNTHSYSITTAPLHGTASVSASGLVTFTPAANYTGPDSLVVRVTDQSAAFGQVTIAVTVAAVNDAPTAVNDAAATPQGTAVTVNVLANDSDADGTLNPATVTLGTLPLSGSATVNPTTGAITYTPNAAFSGTDSFTYTVKDNAGASSNAATVTVNVNAVNQPPVASNGVLPVTEDVAATGTLSATDPEGNALTFSIVSNGTKGTATITNAATGAYIYTPNANANGIDSFTFRVSDGSLNSNAATVTVNITPVNDAPVAVNDTAATPQATPVTVNVLANDSDVDGTLNPATVALTTRLSSGIATVNPATGAITYTPNAAFSGTVSFSYTVKDNTGASSAATVTVNIALANNAPVPTAPAIATNEDTAASSQVAPNDPDVGNTHSYSITAAPLHGTASVSVSGLVSYTPVANYNGPDSLTVRVTDQGGTFGQVTIAVTVAAVNDAPVAVNDPAATTQDTPLTVNVLANDSDPDGTLNPATVALGTLPASGTASVNPTTGAITYTPAVGFSGTASFSYTVKDNGGATSNAATVTISVTAVNQAPVAANGTLAVTEDTAASGSLSATDAEGAALTFSIVGNGTKGVALITNAATGAYTYTPAANANGTDSFTFRASDGSLNSTPATVTVTIAAVNDAPAPTAAAIAVNEDTAGTRLVAPNDPDAGNTHSYSIVTAPLHGTASVSAAGLVSYTPAANYNGPDSLAVRVTDQSGAFGQVTIAVTVAAVNDAPTAVNDPAATPQGTAVTVNVLANDSDADGTLNPATVALGTLPASGSASVNPTTGAITYTPTAAFSGTASFTYTVKDNGGATSNAATVTIAVNAVNQAPVASNGVLPVTEDVAATGTLSASDPEGNALTFSIVSNGTKGTATITNAATGAYTYTPAANANGTDSFTFRVNDGSLNSNVATVMVSIGAVNDAPAPTAPAISTSEDTAGSSQVAPNDPDAGNTHSYSIATSPLHGTASVSASGLVSYTPAANYNGPDSLTVRVTDQSGAFGQVTIPVTVAAVNDAPTAVNDAAATPQGTAVTVNVLANDSDADGTLNPATVTLGTLPLSGSATVNPATGAITYTPNAAFSGTDSFTYTVKDNAGASSNAATVTVNVNAVNQPPVASNGVLPVTEDVAATGTLSATDPEGNALTFSIVSNGTKGTATITNAATGAYVYTPNANTNSTDSFTFRASDGSLNSNLATVTVTISAVNDAPAPTAPAISTSEDTAGSSQVAPNDPDAGNTHSYSITTVPLHGTASVSASGLVTFTPAANYTGPDSLVVRVTDQSAAFGQVTIAITVAAVNDAPAAVNDAAATPQGTAVTVNVLANDSDADGTLNPTTVTLGTLPASGSASVNPTTGAITYTPVAGFSGTASFTYTVKDNGGANSNTATVTVNVTAVVGLVRGDLDGDRDVDSDDITILLANVNLPTRGSRCGTACDLDGDGIISLLDLRTLQSLCTRELCAVQ